MYLNCIMLIVQMIENIAMLLLKNKWQLHPAGCRVSKLKVRNILLCSSFSLLCFSDSEQTTAKLWQIQPFPAIVNINGLHSKSQHTHFVNNPNSDSIACKIIPCSVCMCVCVFGGVGGGSDQFEQSCQFGLIGLWSVLERVTAFSKWHFADLNPDIPP